MAILGIHMERVYVISNIHIFNDIDSVNAVRQMLCYKLVYKTPGPYEITHD
jgi:hypothetical protein